MGTSRPRITSMRRSSIHTTPELCEAYASFSSNLIRSPTLTANFSCHSPIKKNIITFLDSSECTLDVSETELDPLDLMSAVLDQTANMKSTHSSVARKSCLMPKNYLGPTTPDMARQRKTVKFSKEPLSRSATPELTENELSDQFELYMYSRLDQLNRLVPVRADSLPRSSSLQGQRSSMLMKIPKRTSSLNGLSCSYKGLPEEVA